MMLDTSGHSLNVSGTTALGSLLDNPTRMYVLGAGTIDLDGTIIGDHSFDLIYSSGFGSFTQFQTMTSGNRMSARRAARCSSSLRGHAAPTRRRA